MARKHDPRTPELKGHLKTLVGNMRRAQRDLEKLRAIGADEARIRSVMVLAGFGHVTPDEFLAVSTREEMGRLILKIDRTLLN